MIVIKNKDDTFRPNDGEKVWSRYFPVIDNSTVDSQVEASEGNQLWAMTYFESLQHIYNYNVS